MRLPIILDWLAVHQPGILALQETKVEDHVFPVLEFEELGYHVVCHGRKSYNGVAILSRARPRDVRKGLLWSEPDDNRVLTCSFADLTVINTYVPNGSSVGSEKFTYKLRWLKEFLVYLEKNFRPSENIVWAGDINIAPTREDVFSPERHIGKVGFHDDEKCALGKIMDWGFTDTFRIFNRGGGHYSFWEFYLPKAVERNLGWRIDHIYATRSLVERCTASGIDKRPRLAERPSDHTFVWADFDLP